MIVDWLVLARRVQTLRAYDGDIVIITMAVPFLWRWWRDSSRRAWIGDERNQRRNQDRIRGFELIWPTRGGGNQSVYHSH